MYILLCEAQLKAKQESLPNAASELIKIMKDDVSRFAGMIFLSNSGEETYWNFPIFKYAKTNEFIDNLLKLQPKDRRVVIYAMDERYKHETTGSKLTVELDWLREVRELLKTESEKKRENLVVIR